MKNFPKTDNFFVRHATAVALTIVTLLMILAAILFYFQGKADDEAEGSVMHTYQVTGHIQLLFNRIKDVELGERGYIIAGDEAYLAPYYDALKDSLGEDAKSTGMEQHHSIAEELTILRKFTEDNPVQQQNLDEMASDMKELLDYWATTIQLRHDKGKTMGPKFDFQRGDKLMDNLHSLVAIMMAEENNLLSLRIKADEASTRQINIFTFSGIAFFYISIVMFTWFYQKSRREAHTTQQQLIEKLADSNTELERFAYVASHDMQEPLRMITNFSELIAKEYAGKLDEDGKEYIKIVMESSTRMQRMVNDLLEYARFGGDAMSFATINVAKELKHVLENLSAAIEECNAQITYDEFPEIKGNPVQFMRLLQNLIGNGLKYQPENATPGIHIGVEDTGNNLRFAVRDNGIGMLQEYASQIFEPFRRLHTWQEYQGTGIGLAVCKKIVENHGGKIWVISEPGKGSVFYFTLPKTKEGNL